MQTNWCQHAESEIKIKWMCSESIICVESEKLHLYFVTSYQQFSTKSECYKSWQTVTKAVIETFNTKTTKPWIQCSV